MTTHPFHPFMPPELQPSVPFRLGHVPRSSTSANDCRAASEVATARFFDLNEVVARIVGDVVARLNSSCLNIALRLAPGAPLVQGNVTELQFAVAGVLSGALRCLDPCAENEIAVDVHTMGGFARVIVTAEDLPPLSVVRALTLDPYATDVDRTVAHCRRLIEAEGGRIELTEHRGKIAFAIALPTFMLTSPARMHPPLPMQLDRLAIAS